MSSLSELHLCVDRMVPDALRPAGSSLESNVRDVASVLSRLPELNADERVERARAALLTPKKWPNGITLRCRFLDGSPTQRERVEAKAHIWEGYADIRLRFVQSTDEHIRISFSEDGSWSAVGTDALNSSYFPKHQSTMNYGWLEDDTDDEEYSRVVLHEFGHAFGLIHEHQSPGATLNWNVDEVYRVFGGPPNYWNREDIEHNVLQRYAGTQTQYTAFDHKSIMLYAFPGSLFVDGVGTSSNSTLSSSDISFIGRVYGKPAVDGGEARVLKVTSPYMRGRDVEEVQQQLNDAGYGPLAVDGIYGPRTASAVRRFQDDHGLQVDGIVGSQTREALGALVRA